MSATCSAEPTYASGVSVGSVAKTAQNAAVESPVEVVGATAAPSPDDEPLDPHEPTTSNPRPTIRTAAIFRTATA